MSYESERRRIAVFDTTLRDGEQAPGFSMSIDAKLAMARQLAKLKVDVIEAGFAAASPGDAEAVRRIAEEIEGPTICSLSRARADDIDAAARALAPARRSRLHIFLGTSPIHRQAKLGMTTGEVLREIERSVTDASRVFDEIEFSAEDAIRTERSFLIEALECAAAAGARVLNVPDTVGYTTPEEIYALFRDLMDSVRRPAHAVFSVHCHDDLGMAVANSLAAIRAGAAQVECTINGIGERAGNSALEEVVMALKTRLDRFDADTGVVASELCGASRLLGDLTGQRAPRNKAIVGRNAFAHEAGIHQHGVLSDPRTYEIMRPADVGAPESALILGKHSGKHALRARVAALGVELGDDRVEALFEAFKGLADEQGEVTDEDLLSLIAGDGESAEAWSLVRLEIRASEEARARPFVRLTLDHVTRGRLSEIGAGEAPFEAAFSALCAATGRAATLDSVEVARAPAGLAAEVAVGFAGRRYMARATQRDPIVAATRALVAAFNQIERRERRAGAPARSAA